MTRELNLAENIVWLRKQRKLTQEDLAKYMGVSKASVSKWETGQSFPDIVFLPQLATYFGISIDKLMGYEAQLSKQGIKDAYARLCLSFAEKPFEVAHAECQDLIRDYYSCYPLISQMAALYLNHLQQAPNQETRELLIHEAIELCQRVRVGGDGVFELRQANSVEALLRLIEGNAAATVELLEDSIVPTMGESVILASAYQALGEAEKAQETLQADLYQSLVGILNILPQLAMNSISDPKRLERLHNRTLQLIDTFDMDALYMNACALHLIFASAYAGAGNTDKAIECLERYARICLSAKFPMTLHGDNFFDKVQPLFDELGTGDGAPRDEALIKQSMIQGVAANPAFDSLTDDGRFKRIVKDLEAKLS